jgi:hypothetical protein
MQELVKKENISRITADTKSNLVFYHQKLFQVIDHATPSPLEGGHQWREGGTREDYGKLVEELTMLAEF